MQFLEMVWMMVNGGMKNMYLDEDADEGADER
jgi:hypothetical protein